MNSWEFYILKAGALLHDPPNKAWVVTGKTIVKGSHKDFARKLAERILDGTVFSEVLNRFDDGRIKRADTLSSSIDRWLLNILIKGDYRKLQCKEVKLKNIFDPNPNYEISSIPPPNIDKLERFAEKLNEMVRGVSDRRILWHLLYTLYEAIWIEEGLPASPADTRVPTHTVFDHAYAAASLLNWFIEDKDSPKGLLLMIDLAGVQKFVKSSRKLRDLWVSSYLVSSIAWRLAWEFVEELGPDILLIPTCRHNQFYYHSLLALLKNRIDDEKIQKIKNIVKLMSGYDPDEDVYPKSPIIPATLTLILPGYKVLSSFDKFKNIKNADDLKNYLEKLYREIWKHIYDKVSSVEIKEKQYANINDYVRSLKDFSKYGFKDVPPLRLRILAVDIADIARKIIEDDKDIYLLYTFAFKKLYYEVSQAKLFKVDPSTDVNLTDWTEDAYRGESIGYPKPSSRGFDYCTVCGAIPAGIIVDSDILEPYFSKGEKLCPYCLLKRFVGIGEVLEEIIGSLIGRGVSQKKFRLHFPSVSDVASIEFKEDLIRQLEIRENIEKVLELLKDAISNTIRVRPTYMVEEILWKPQRDLLESLEKLEIEASMKELLKFFCIADAESLYFGEEYSRRIWRNTVEKINEIRKELGVKVKPPGSYYALIKCDGDSIGKLISGDISKATNLKIKDYIKDLFEGPAKEIIQYIVEGEDEKAKEKAREEGIEEDRVNRVKELINTLIRENEIPNSIAYHVSLSRALMRAAVRDIEVIEKAKGIVVYAGGDDLLALAPVSQELDIVYKTRRLFSLGSEIIYGFDLINKYHIPSLISVGRSYCVYESHYMYPMYMVMERLNDLLDRVAKDSIWFKDDLRRTKDSCIIAYSPRGGERIAILSFTPSLSIKDIGWPLWIIKDILCDIISGNISSSLIYDFKNIDKVMMNLVKEGDFSILERVIEKIFRDNILKARGVNWSRYVGLLSEAMKWRRESQGDPTSGKLFLGMEIVKALHIVRSGLRGGL